MSAYLQLQDRLRTGLRAAADALPQATPVPAEVQDLPVVHLRRPAPRRRVPRGAMATMAAAAAVIAAMVVAGGPAGEDGPDAVGSGPSPSATTSAPGEVRVTNGQVPGQAVASGSSLRTYGPDGQQTGSLDVAPLRSLQAASSDLDGGWVVCGLVDEPVAPGETMSGFPDRVMWHPAERDPVQIQVDGKTPPCWSSSMRVVDSADGPLLVYVDQSIAATGLRLSGLVLGTDQKREILDLPDVSVMPDGWAATTDRVVVQTQDGGVRLFDLTTGEELPAPAVDLAWPSELELAPDGNTLAALVGGDDGPIQLVVYDLSTGDQLFQKDFDISGEGDGLSFDGTTLAVGSYHANPVTVIDLATGTERTIDDHGVLL